MAIVWFVVHVIYALLAAFGLFVALAIVWWEWVPSVQSWFADVQEGCARYRGVRMERRLVGEAMDAAARSEAVVQMSKDRMAAAVRYRS